MKATGSADMMLKPTAVIDLKTKAELDTVRRDGPSFKEKAQIAGYLIGAIQGKQLGPEATGHLVYIDRSGREKTAYVWSLDVPMAEAILMAVGDRLQDVANAIETGQRAPRDEHQSWCRRYSARSTQPAGRGTNRPVRSSTPRDQGCRGVH